MSFFMQAIICIWEKHFINFIGPVREGIPIIPIHPGIFDEDMAQSLELKNKKRVERYNY